MESLSCESNRQEAGGVIIVANWRGNSIGNSRSWGVNTVFELLAHIVDYSIFNKHKTFVHRQKCSMITFTTNQFITRAWFHELPTVLS